MGLSRVTSQRPRTHCPWAGGTGSIHLALTESDGVERTLSCSLGASSAWARESGRQDQSSELLPPRAGKFMRWTYWEAAMESREHRVLDASLGAQGGRKREGERGERGAPHQEGGAQECLGDQYAGQAE